MHAEERLLASEFGAEYEAYRTRTWRLIPGLY
jgi:protein-S-isoprenylcysteine O-methyltransferase Ste14